MLPIGDSISVGYDGVVTGHVAGVARVPLELAPTVCWYNPGAAKP